MEFKNNVIHSRKISGSNAIKSKLITYETHVLGSWEINPENPPLHTSHVLTCFHHYGHYQRQDSGLGGLWSQLNELRFVKPCSPYPCVCCDPVNLGFFLVFIFVFVFCLGSVF